VFVEQRLCHDFDFTFLARERIHDLRRFLLLFLLISPFRVISEAESDSFLVQISMHAHTRNRKTLTAIGNFEGVVVCKEYLPLEFPSTVLTSNSMPDKVMPGHHASCTLARGRHGSKLTLATPHLAGTKLDMSRGFRHLVDRLFYRFYAYQGTLIGPFFLRTDNSVPSFPMVGQINSSLTLEITVRAL